MKNNYLGGVCILGLFILPSLIFLIIIAYEFYTRNNIEFSFCVTEKCLGVVLEEFPNLISFYIGYLKFVPLLIASASLYVASSNYKLSVKNSSITNHINNFKLFSDFISEKLAQKRYINSADVDVHYLYSLIFPDSKLGDISASEEYLKEVKRIRMYLIKASSLGKKSGRSTSFNYEEHQRKMIKLFNALGFSVDKNHRNDFYFVEDDIFELIDKITLLFANKSFRNPEFLLEKINRHYR